MLRHKLQVCTSIVSSLYSSIYCVSPYTFISTASTPAEAALQHLVIVTYSSAPVLPDLYGPSPRPNSALAARSAHMPFLPTPHHLLSGSSWQYHSCRCCSASSYDASSRICRLCHPRPFLPAALAMP